MSSSSQNRWCQCSVFCKEAVKLLKEDKIHGVRPFPIDCVVVREEKQAMGLDRRAHWVEQWESLGTGPSLTVLGTARALAEYLSVILGPGCRISS